MAPRIASTPIDARSASVLMNQSPHRLQRGQMVLAVDDQFCLHTRLFAYAESLQHSRYYSSTSYSGKRKSPLKCRGKLVIQRCPKQTTRAMKSCLHRFRTYLEQ